MNTRTLDISGMHCAACVGAVESALLTIPGIDSATVNLVTNRAVVTMSEPVTDTTLQSAVEAAGYGVEAIYTERSRTSSDEVLSRLEAPAHVYRRALLISAPFSTLIVIIAMTAMWGSYPTQINVLLLALTIPVLWSGRMFFRGALQALRHRRATMDTLVALGTGSAFVISLLMTFDVAGLPVHAHAGAYYDSTATIITLVLLGKWLESRAKQRTAETLAHLMELHPQTATVIRNSAEISIPAADVVVGDIFVIRPGERVPVDGVIISGSVSVDESMLTGESLPVERHDGQVLIGGSINTLGTCSARATAVGNDTVLAGIIRSVESAQASKAPVQRLADSISGVFVPIVLVIAIVTYVGWIAVSTSPDPAGHALVAAISVLVIACPCALGLATPTAIIVGTGAAARRGILFANAGSLERLGSSNTIVLDKTGTLTKGTPCVMRADFVVHPKLERQRVLSLILSLEHRSEHPLARAIATWCQDHGGSQFEVTLVQTHPGRGTTGTVDGHRLRIGNEQMMAESLLIIPEPLTTALHANDQQGCSTVLVSIDGAVCAAFGISDELREEAPQVVAELRSIGQRVIMLTGDRAEAATAIAAQVGIDEVIHSVTPDRKREVIETLQRRGSTVVMVGDGINDAPSLAQADVGIALGSATDVAKSTADVTLMRNDLHAITTAIAISRSTMRIIRQNFSLAFIYNVIGIPLAAGLFLPLFGVQLTPMYAAFAMAMSSVTVVSNSLRLRSL